jgi:hypothetical protein
MVHRLLDVPAWSTVTITLGASLITALATLGGVLLLQRFQRAERERERTEALITRTAEVIGPLRRVLEEANPHRVSLNLGEQSLDQHHDRRSRWEALRSEVLTVSILHPVAETAEALERASVDVGNALMSSGWIAYDWASGDRGERKSQRETALEDFAKAQTSIANVKELLRPPPSSGPDEGR